MLHKGLKQLRLQLNLNVASEWYGIGWFGPTKAKRSPRGWIAARPQ